MTWKSPIMWLKPVDTMTYGLELRSPFLDHLLMEKIAIMPSQMIGIIFDKRKIETYMAEYFKTHLNYDNNIFCSAYSEFVV